MHAEKPGVHDLISSSVQFYDKYQKGGERDPTSLEGTIMKHWGEQVRANDQLGQSFAELSNLRNYDKDVAVTIIGDDGAATETHLPAIEILRRLEVGTQPIKDTPPTTSDAILNHRIALFMQDKETGTGRDAFGEALAYANALLAIRMREGAIGIEPATVAALAWLRYEGATLLHETSYDDQYIPGLYYHPWFQEVLRFQELTASDAAYDEAAFETFLEQLKAQKEPEDAYKLIASRTAHATKQLSKVYEEQGKIGWSEAIKTGITHELSWDLPFDQKPSTGSIAGGLRQSRIEAQEAKRQRTNEPHYHPGG